MSMQPVDPQTHPARLAQYMQAMCGDLHKQAKAIREETNTENCPTRLEDLADQVENLASVVHSLTIHIARQH